MGKSKHSKGVQSFRNPTDNQIKMKFHFLEAYEYNAEKWH